MQKVVKFGGSSLADSNQFKKVKAMIEADESRSASHNNQSQILFDYVI